MHDPMIVAHEIKYPWCKYKPWPKKFRHSGDRKFAWRRMTDAEKQGCDSFWEEGYRDTFITIWHVDPEKDGSDDSCGYSYIKLTKEQRERLRNAAWIEGNNPHFLTCLEKTWRGAVTEAETLYRGMVLLVCRVLRIRITFDEVCKYASEACHVNRDVGKIGDVFCFLPGYHTNSKEDSKEDRQEHFFGILCGVARVILTDRRPWWKHPKWHVWHWEFQCHPLQTFKRWAFSRCCKCGKRFHWGYSPVTNNWNAKGPRWFRGETDVYHSDCNHPANPCLASAEKAQ